MSCIYCWNLTFSQRAWPHKDSFSIPQEKCVLVLYVTSQPSSHSKLCQWTWATAVFGVVETPGLVSMAAPRPLTRAAQAPPRGLLLMFPSPPLGPASQLWWTPSAQPWWLSPSHKRNPSLADITCTPNVSVPLHAALHTRHSSEFFQSDFWALLLHSLI